MVQSRARSGCRRPIRPKNRRHWIGRCPVAHHRIGLASVLGHRLAQRQTARQTHTHTHTKTDIETQWQTQTQTDRHRRTDSVYHRTGLASVLWHKLVSHHTAKQTDRQRDRHKQRDRQTDTALGPYRIADFYYSE